MLKKLVIFSVAFAMVFCAVGFSSAPAEAEITLTPGTLIMSDVIPSVYYYGSDLKRYTYPSSSIYNTWRSDYNDIVKISMEELADVPLYKNIVVRPGTNLVKINTIPKVYAVLPNGQMRHIANEDAAKRLYGDNWGSKVIDIPDSFWFSYTDLKVPLSGMSYPEGQIVKENGGTDYYYVNEDGSWSMFASMEVFEQARFNEDYIVEAPADMDFILGAEITDAAYLADDAQVE